MKLPFRTLFDRDHPSQETPVLAQPDAGPLDPYPEDWSLGTDGIDWSVPMLLDRPALVAWYGGTSDALRTFVSEHRDALSAGIAEKLAAADDPDRVRLGFVLAQIDRRWMALVLIETLERSLEQYPPKDHRLWVQTVTAALTLLSESDVPSSLDAAARKALLAIAARHLEPEFRNGPYSRLFMRLKAFQIARNCAYPALLDTVNATARSLLEDPDLAYEAAQHLSYQGDPVAWPVVKRWMESSDGGLDEWIYPHWLNPVLMMVARAAPETRRSMSATAAERLQRLLDDRIRDVPELSLGLVMVLTATGFAHLEGQARDDYMGMLATSWLDPRIRFALKMACVGRDPNDYLPAIEDFANERRLLEAHGWDNTMN